MMHTLSAFAGHVVIVGAGLAGLVAALKLERPCVVLSPTLLGEGAASMLAQGGIASAVGPDDSPALHAQDTLAAGAGLCDAEVVQRITAAGPAAIAQLRDWGVSFAGTPEHPDLHLEAAHTRPRILHLNGDRSGAGIMRPLIARVKNHGQITLLEQVALSGFCTENGELSGVRTTAGYIPTTQCLIASGGIGGLFAGATCPAEAQGLPLAQAARIGAALVDMEFTQFHPTGLAMPLPDGRRALVSEAVRGAGARLIDERGERFTEELQPRDIVARAIAAHRAAGHQVFLDARSLPKGPFSTQFPGIAAACHAAGIDPDQQPILVQPSMHYHMGGLAVDAAGRTTIPGLWACGEAACTGLHGANRLASNSLLEAVLTGQWAAQDINQHEPSRALSHGKMVEPYQGPTPPDLSEHLVRYAGILRDEAGLKALLQQIAPYAQKNDAALVTAFLAAGALLRQESRGAHYRTDYPEQKTPERRVMTYSDLKSFGVGLS
ncbi:L-aspartate oxidase [Neokomagataea anthophila]|uniref:L-aspartate oxidase n=1 Tax=Neokomagataea anthophila TaxID=2826925 RepID=A0ABS5E4V2_9PROT|nr:L-aspartate oxidase [Neokomagataea anthophila]MBR0558925.1 L-aspartate oxidase [Neokomagataea anthophila]